MTKDEILETYLNTVYFGSGAYGVQAAAETYWGKNVGELNWAEGGHARGGHLQPGRLRPHPPPRGGQEAARHRPRPHGAPTAPSPARRPPFAKRGRCPPAGAPVWPAPRPADCGEIVQPPARQATSSTRSRSELLDLTNHEYDATSAPPTTSATTPCSVAACASTPPSTRWPRPRPGRHDAPGTPSPPARRPKGVTTAMVSIEPSTGAVRALVGGPGLRQLQVQHRHPRARPPDRLVVQDLRAAHRPRAGRAARRLRRRRRLLPNPGGTPDPYVVSRLGRHAHLGRRRVVERRLRPPRPDRRPRQRRRHGRAPRRHERVRPQGQVDAARRVRRDARSRWRRPTRPSPTAASASPSTSSTGSRTATATSLYHPRRRPAPGRFSQQTACLATQILENNVKAGTGTERPARRPARRRQDRHHRVELRHLVRGLHART